MNLTLVHKHSEHPMVASPRWAMRPKHQGLPRTWQAPASEPLGTDWSGLHGIPHTYAGILLRD